MSHVEKQTKLNAFLSKENRLRVLISIVLSENI